MPACLPSPLAELLRENKRMLDRAIRELDRERMGLQQQEKKLIMEIKKMAKEGQMVGAAGEPPPAAPPSAGLPRCWLCRSWHSAALASIPQGQAPHDSATQCSCCFSLCWSSCRSHIFDRRQVQASSWPGTPQLHSVSAAAQLPLLVLLPLLP